jgi:hypothetical protein
MSLRLLLAVVVAGALVAASLPAIDAAQRAHAEGDLETTVTDIESATTALVRHSDPVPPGVPAATRRVRVPLSEGSSGARLIIGPAAGDSGTKITVHVPGAPPGVTVLNATVRPPERDRVSWNGSLTVGDEARLTLEYRRVDGQPVITVARGFK